MRPRSSFAFLVVFLIAISIGIMYSGLGAVDVSEDLDLDGYTSEDLSYFTDIAFCFPDKIKKWRGPIFVGISGPCNREDSLEVTKIVSELAEVMGHQKIQYRPFDANIHVHFPTSASEFLNKNKGDSKYNSLGFTQPGFLFFSNYVSGADVYINPILKGTSRKTTLRHEFCHAVGLWGHSRKPYPTGHLLGFKVFSSIEDYENADTIAAVIPEADRKAIRLLYQDALQCGLKKSTFVEFLRGSGR